MQAVLNFDLDDEDDRMRHVRCIQSLDMAEALLDISEMAEDIINYDVDMSSDQMAMRIQEILNRRHVNLEKLIVR